MASFTALAPGLKNTLRGRLTFILSIILSGTPIQLEIYLMILLKWIIENLR
ncbi:MAG: hypothetical protein IPO37_25415 [Saprospiraceae bacterium]|nr:hypothetical protein [Saprospiraceae bacterium]